MNLQSYHPRLDRGTLALILTLAWPTMLEQLMQTAVQYIDTAMVGSLGTEATAAVGATSTVNWLVIITISSLGTGFLSFIAKACGAGEREKAARSSSQAVLLTLIAGSLLTVLILSLGRFVPVWMQVDPAIQELSATYFLILYSPILFRTATVIFGTILRAAGDTKTPMRVGILVNLLNVTLNFLLIYPTRTISVFGLSFPMIGAGLGVIGAAIASAIAFAAGGIFITVKLWQHPFLSPRGQSLRPDWTVLQPCFQVALPNMVQRFGVSFGYVTFAAMINSVGEVATAAHTIANTVESAFYIPGFGMQTAAATLAGNAFGARDNEQLKKLTRTCLVIEVLLMLLSGGALFLLATPMMRLFSRSEDVIRLGATVLRMVALSEPFYGVFIIFEGVRLGLGDTKTPLIYNLAGMWGVRITGTFICTQLLHLGLVAAWGCMILHNLLVFTLYTIQYVTGRWNPLARECG
ncbi:MAG: MATE family efflux transporter [Oscillospiraceae bacterium]|nr:MATE family efflux transporter [Oscillospiraceae bacterium]